LRGPGALGGVPLGPQLGNPVVLLPVLCVLGGDGADQGVGGVAVRQEGADREQHLRDGEGRRPLVLEDVEADDPLGVDVAVVDPGAELDLGGLEGVLGGEVDVQEEDSAFVDRAGGPEDGGDPLEEVVTLRPCAAVGGRVQGDATQLLLDPLGGGGQGLGHLGGAAFALLLRLLRRLAGAGIRHFH